MQSLRIPTLLVRGNASPISKDDVERFRTLIPTVRVAVIDSCGHLVARDAPVELAEAVIRLARDADVLGRGYDAAGADGLGGRRPGSVRT